jgi:hypothetical protein
MSCRYCGADISYNANRCPKCGHSGHDLHTDFVPSAEPSGESAFWRMNHFFESLAGQGIFHVEKAEKLKAVAVKLGAVLGGAFGFFVGVTQHSVGAVLIATAVGVGVGALALGVGLALIGWVGMFAIYLVPLAAIIGIVWLLFNLKF